jgi:hypothetical protein
LLVSPAAPNSNPLFRAVAFIVGFAVIMIAYHTILEGVAGTTLGWWLTEIAVAREDCAEVGLRRSALRNSMRLVARYLSSCISARHNHRSEQQKKAAARGQVVRTVVINI